MREKLLEIIESRIEEERSTAIKKIAENLKADGADFCIECGEKIAKARRLALPSAKRCLKCQKAEESRQ